MRPPCAQIASSASPLSPSEIASAPAATDHYVFPAGADGSSIGNGQVRPSAGHSPRASVPPLGIELKRMRGGSPSFSISMGSDKADDAIAAPAPQSLSEALEALAAAQAQIQQLQTRLRDSGDTQFGSKGMDHSKHEDGRGGGRVGSRPMVDFDLSRSATRNGLESHYEQDGQLTEVDAEQGVKRGGVSRMAVWCPCLHSAEADGPGQSNAHSLSEYFATPLWRILLKRLPWLIGLLLLQSFSASILHRYDGYLEAHILFTYFIPMIVGTGGNAGNQCSVMVTRALALGMADTEVWRIVKKEIPTALLTAITLGFFAWLRVIAEYPSSGNEAVAIALTLGVSIVISIMLGIAFSYTIGLMNRCDPADGAAPLLTTISDLIGISLLCGIATGLVP